MHRLNLTSRRTIVVAFGWVLTLSFNALALDTSIRGNVRALQAVDVKHDDPSEHYAQTDSRLFTELALKSDNFSGVASLLARYDLYFGHDSKQRFDFDLYEAYARYGKGPWAIEGGQRVLRWGVMEYVSPTDAINPRDLRQIIDPEVEDRYLPVSLLRLLFEKERWVVEGIYQPFFRASAYDLFGTDASIYRPALSKLLGSPFVDVGALTDDASEQDLQEAAFNLDRPNQSFINGEGGVRVTARPAKTELSILYLSKRETLPALVFSGASISPGTGGLGTGTFPRNHLAGATARWVDDSGVTLKGEMLFQNRSSAYSDTLVLMRERSLQGAAGFEYDFNLKHLFTIEYAFDRIMSGPDRAYFLRDRTQQALSAAAILTFLERTWTIELKGTTGLNQQAYLLRPKLAYHPVPQWEFALGGNVWGGEANSVMGLLTNNDEIFGSANWMF